MTATAAADKMPASLFEALARFQADLPKIIKGQTADTGKYVYDYADLADVSDAVLKAIGKLGMFFFAKPLHRQEDGKFGLEYTLGHISGEREDGWWELRSDLPMQQMGGMITYARRYVLLAVTGAAPAGDDNDAADTSDVPSRSAGDAWENSTPARPQDSRPWIETARKKASTFRSEAEGYALYREAAARHIAGEIGRDEQDEIQNTVKKRIDERRRDAATRILKPVPEDDPWRIKILDELGSDDDARETREELGRLMAAGTIDETRAQLLDRAVVALFPKAAVKAGDGDA